MAKRENTDYLKFNAFAIRDLIIRKLAQDSNYTDQIYSGSNIQILIDIISYMYQTLLYNLNSAASETMWSDTRIYENINRLSQFLGYSPHGMNPACAMFTFPTLSSDTETHLLRYSYLDSGKTDAAGNHIFFSTVTDTDLRPNSTSAPEILMYNGKWKLYDTVFVAEGTDWETFVLNGVRSDASTGNYVANNYIHVYVAEPEGESYKDPEQFYMTDEGLFKSRNEYFADIREATASDTFKPYPKIYQPNDKIFSLRLDETKTYTITFGNGRQGKKLKKGSAIYVFYLESNGPIENININEINNATIYSNLFSYQYTKDGRNFTAVFEKNSEKNYLTYVKNVSNSSPLLGFALEESVDEIRDFAPNWFRMGNRLVTKRDYEYYMKNSPQFRGVFADVKCMNNWEYMSTFYKWLYDLGLKYHSLNGIDTLNGRRFLTQSKILSSGRRYADPADSNNIYLWYVMRSDIDPSISNELKDPQSNFLENARKHLLTIKDLTHEPTFSIPIKVMFTVAAVEDTVVNKQQSNDEVENRLWGDVQTIDTSNSTKDVYLEISVEDDIVYASATLQNRIRTIIEDFFKDNLKLGGYIDFNVLQASIFDINGITKIRTVYNNNGVYTIRNGISFASWSEDQILEDMNKKLALDLEISSAGRSLEPFQYPILDVDSLKKLDIKIIKKSAAALNTVIY